MNDGASADQQSMGSCWTLIWFGVVYGLKINLEKSKPIPIGGALNVEELVLVLGCRVGALPTTYLGLILGASFKSTLVWDGEERFQRRFAGWKRQYTLIKLACQATQAYQFTTHP